MTPRAGDEGNDRPRPAAWVAPVARRLGDRLDAIKARNIGIVTLATVAALLAVSFATATNNRTIFGTMLGSDFAAFYSAGATLNDGAGDRLYDFASQYARYHALLPDAAAGESLPYANPPFFAALCRPLAALPYALAYAVWLTCSAALFYAGLRLVWGEGVPGSAAPPWSAVAAVALSFEPIAVECLAGGQASAFGFFWFAVAIRSARAGRPARAGLALSLCSYKPTLLVLVLPMLLVTRQFRALGGFAAGATALAAASLAVVGASGCARYGDVLFNYAGSSAWSGAVFRTWKFVDARSFYRLLIPNAAAAASALAVVTAAVGLAFLARFWWRSPRDGAPASRDALWAVTLTATLVLNVYVPIYDTALLALAAVLYLRATRAELTARDRAFMIVLWSAPWVSQSIALATGFQPCTVLLAAFCAHQCGRATRAWRPELRPCAPPDPAQSSPQTRRAAITSPTTIAPAPALPLR